MNSPSGVIPCFLSKEDRGAGIRTRDLLHPMQARYPGCATPRILARSIARDTLQHKAKRPYCLPLPNPDSILKRKTREWA